MLASKKVPNYNHRERILQMKKYVVLLAVMMIVGCGAPKEEITKQRIIDTLASSGFVGEEKPKMFQMLGAVDGFGITGEDFVVELYEFPDAKLAKECPICKMANKWTTNGQWGIMIHEGKRGAEEILPIFLGL
jgi:hypothetical protein